MAVDKSVVDNNPKVLEKEAEFDEEEAYFELCEIIEMARQTGNYTRFQNDLNQWKKHYPIELFSDKYKSKIKYMLSEEFLDSILKNYLAFERYSKLDPNKQLDKFRKIFSRAEQHKDPKKLDTDLQNFYKDYPLEYLKEKFPHIVSKLTSKSHRAKILEKFDSSEAYEEFIAVIYNTENFSSLSDLEDALKPLKEKYPLEDFSDEYRSKLEPLLTEASLKQILESANEATSLDISDLDDGTIIALEGQKALSESSGTISQKTAYFELLEIMKNPNDLNGVFNWAYRYMKHISKFDDYHKGLILSTLTPYYKIPKQSDYKIPVMNSQSHDHLSYDEYQSIDEIKQKAILQYLAIISTTGALTNTDIERLETIHSNSIKAQAVNLVATALDMFVEEADNSLSLTLSDPEYFGTKPNASGSTGGSGGSGIAQFQEIKKRNNNGSGSTDGGTTIAHIEEPETNPKPSDFIFNDTSTTSSNSLEDEKQNLVIDYNNEFDTETVDIKISKTKSSNDEPAISTEDGNASGSDDETIYKIIPFEDNGNDSNDLERNSTPNHNYVAPNNAELSLEDNDENSNNDTNKTPIPEPDRSQDFSTFRTYKSDDDGERDL